MEQGTAFASPVPAAYDEPAGADAHDADAYDEPADAAAYDEAARGAAAYDEPAGHSATAGGLPEELAAWLAAAPIVVVAAGGAHAWDAVARRAALVAFDKVTNALTVARAKVVAAEQDAGTWALVGGARNMASFLGQLNRQGLGAGFAELRQATALASMPAVAEAMVDGDVTAKHLAEITKATTASPTVAQELATPAGQAALVELAKKFDGAAFGKHLARFAAGTDPAARQREHDAQRARRRLTVTHHPDGTEIQGFVDAVTGYKFQKALDAYNPRPAEDDKRGRDERQADALDGLLTQVLSDERTTPGAVAPVQAIVTVSEETWLALRAARGDAGTVAGDAGAAGEGDGGAAGEGDNHRSGTAVGIGNGAPGKGSAADLVRRLRGVAAVADENGQPWPASEVGRALCNCQITRVVVDAKMQVLDLGRAEKNRLFNRTHWLALLAAGVTTCSVGGCSIPLRYCELHHIWWWDNGGPTDLSNVAPECSFHHHDIHKNDIRIIRRPDGTFEHRWPDGRIYGTPAPDNGQPSGAGADECGTSGDRPTADRGVVGQGVVADHCGALSDQSAGGWSISGEQAEPLFV